MKTQNKMFTFFVLSRSTAGENRRMLHRSHDVSTTNKFGMASVPSVFDSARVKLGRFMKGFVRRLQGFRANAISADKNTKKVPLTAEEICAISNDCIGHDFGSKARAHGVSERSVMRSVSSHAYTTMMTILLAGQIALEELRKKAADVVLRESDVGRTNQHSNLLLHEEENRCKNPLLRPEACTILGLEG